MDFGLSDDQSLFQQSLRSFLADKVPTERVRSIMDTPAAHDASLVAQLNHDLMYGAMSSSMNTTLSNMVTALPDSNPTGRVTGALQVLLASPEFAIEK